MLNYYECYIPRLSIVLHVVPLQFLGKDIPWFKSSKHSMALQEAKYLLNSASLLVHFDSTKNLGMS